MNPEPGWYPDPFDPSQDRWWNGTAWTENTQAGPQSPDPYADARAEATPAGGDYVSELVDDEGTNLPDYEILASVEEGAKDRPAEAPSDFPAVSMSAAPAPNEWGEDGIPGSGKGAARKRLAKILGISALVGLILMVSGTAAAFFLLNGRGPQVEDVLPANTAFMARVDLDPSLEQKTNVIRLLSRFPQFENSNQEVDGTAPQQSLLDLLGDSQEGSQELVSDAKSWVGPRLGVGFIPSASAGYSPVLVIAVTDESALDAFMAKHAGELYYVVKDGYAIISDTESAVASVMESNDSLSQSQAFQSSQERLALDAIGLLWADASKAESLRDSLSDTNTIENPLGGGLISTPDSVNAAGYLMLGIAAEPDAVRVAAVTESLTVSDTPNLGLGVSGDGISELPSDTLGAVSLANPSGILDDLLRYLGNETPGFDEEIDNALDQLGITRDSLTSFLGGQLTFAVVPGENEDSVVPFLAISAQGGENKDNEAILGAISDSLQGFLGGNGVTDELVTVERDGVVFIVSNSQFATLETALESGGNLSSTQAYTRAFPNGSGGLIAFFAGDGLMSRAQDLTEEDFVGQILSLGITATVDSEAAGNSRTEIVLAFR